MGVLRPRGWVGSSAVVRTVGQPGAQPGALANAVTRWWPRASCAARRSGDASRGRVTIAGGVQQAVAEPFGFGAGEVAVEAEHSGPGEQVVRDEHEVSHAVLIANRAEGRFAKPGVFGVADLSFGAASARGRALRGRRCRGRAVGDEHLEAVPVDVGEGELRAGVGFFAAGDHPDARRASRRQVDEVGDLRDFGAFAFIAAVGGDRRPPTPFGTVTRTLRRPRRRGDARSTNRTLTLAARVDEPVREPAESARAITSTSVGVDRQLGQCVIEHARRDRRRCPTRRCRAAATRRALRRSRPDTPAADGTRTRACRSAPRPAFPSATSTSVASMSIT